MALLATLPGSSLAQSAQQTADDVRGQRNTLLDRYKAGNVSVDDAAAYTGANTSMSGGRAAKSGSASTSTTRTVSMLCKGGPRSFANSDGTYLSTISCAKGGTLTMRACTPDRPSTDASCPTVTSGGASLTVSYTNNSVTISITACADPVTEKCDFRVRMDGSSVSSWSRGSIESDGTAASLRPETYGATSNRAAVNNPNTMAAYNSVDRNTQYSRMQRVESGAAGGRLVDGNGTDLGPLNQGGSCVKTCVGTVGDGTTTKSCVQSLDTYQTGCHTEYPRIFYNYAINRADATCSAVDPATCVPATSPPAGYGGWIKYREDPHTSGQTYTSYFAAFENFSPGPPASKPVTSTTRSGPTITDESQCTRTGGSCVTYDANLPGQCRVYQHRSYCPFDRATSCQDSAYIAGQPTPPSGQSGFTQYNNPGPKAYTLSDGRQCSIGDLSLDTEAVADGEATCSLSQDGVCVDVPGQAECRSDQQATPPPCTGPKYTGCTVTGTGRCTATSPAGTCTEWTTDYSCPTTNPQCQRYKTVCSANGVVYSEEEDQSSSGWKEAAATMSTVDQMTSEAKDACKKNGTCDMRTIRVFNGTAEGCKKQVGASFAGKLCDFTPPDYTGTIDPSSPCLGGPIRTNCCDEDLTKEQDSLIGGRCGSGDISLAAARRQERAIRLGERCSDRINLGFAKPCIEREQLWCWWPTVLAKEINIQGREQLKAIYATTSSTTSGSTNMNWNYFASNDTGNWTPVVTMGSTRLMAWQWPAFCSAPKDVRQSNSNCGSNRESYLMTCADSDCATVVPTHPTKSTVDAPHWYAINVPRYGEGSASYPLGKYGFAEGACTGTSCDFRITSSTEARSRNSVGLMELEWPWTDPETTIGERAMNAQYAIIAYPNAPGTPVSGNARIGFSTAPNLANPDATVYTYYNLPTDGSSRTITVSGKTIQVQGECDTHTNLCNHRFYVPMTITPKRWNKNGLTDKVEKVSELDCSGFTLDEFALLDVGKMNLDPVIASMTNGNAGGALTKAQASTATYAASASTTFTKKETEYNAGKTQVRNNTQYASDVITLTPAAGKAPWTTTLTYPSLYPNSSTSDYSADPYTRKGTPVHEVTIDWGDGNTNTYTPGSGANNEVTHTYEAGPNKLERDWDIVATFKLNASSDGAAIPTPVVANGAVTSCGPGCMRVQLGRSGNDYLGDDHSNCQLFGDQTSIRVLRPDLIESAKLIFVSADDYLRAKVNDIIVWNGFDPAWTYPTARCGENSNRGSRNLNVDVTSYFTSVAPGGSVKLSYDLSVANEGDGLTYWEIRSTETCRFETDACPGGVTAGNGLTRVVKARAASRYDESDLSRGSGGAQDSVDEMDTRAPAGTTVPPAR